MPFITNDFDLRLVDDEEYVEEKYKEYVIARKLYVWLDTPFSDDDYLYRRFKKYGNIELTEILRSGKEGYVTFTCDRNACLAHDREKDNSVEVAYSWHQPIKAQTNSDDRQDQSIDNSPLVKLNDNCLFAVFDLCDNQSLVHLAETCKRFNTLLRLHYKFPKNRDFELYGEDRSLMSLADVRKIVRLIGPYFHTLDLYLVDMEVGWPLRYLQIVMKYCEFNPFIRQLTISTEGWHENFNALVRPILKNLQELKLWILKGTDNGIVLPDFTALCPNLKKIVTDIFVDKFSKATIPGLESFSFENYFNNLTPDAMKFFIANPQIKVFKCCYLCSGDIQNIAAHFPNVQKLSFHLDEQLSPNEFQHLKEFKHLTKLKLNFVPYFFQEMPKIKLRETFECFRQFVNLSELKLYFKDKNRLSSREIQRSIIALSGMLPSLERFDLVGLKLLESTVVDFVRSAAKLKSLHLHIVGEIYANESLITMLVASRKSRQQDKLNLFLDSDLQNNAIAINAADVQHYLSVKWDCEHDLRWVEHRLKTSSIFGILNL